MIEKFHNEACDIHAHLTMLNFRVNVVNADTIDELENDLVELIMRQVQLELDCLKSNAA